MTPREELIALRRLAELEAKAGGAAPAADEGFAPALGRQVLNLGAGAIRGAGSFGATAMGLTVDPLARAVGSTGFNIPFTDVRVPLGLSGDKRRADMTAALSGMGADTDSFAFGAGKLGGEIAGTLGVGGVLARGAGAVGAAPSVVNALSTAGFRGGASVAPNVLARAADLGMRSGAGAVVGGASAGMIDPGSAGLGAVIGGVLPGGLQAVGAAGGVAGRVFKSTKTKATERLAAALESDIAAAAAKLRRGAQLVPGSKPTVAQLLRTPQASTLERVVSESAGGGNLKARYLAQNEARQAALDSVARVDPRGLRSAQQDFGTNALSAVRGGDSVAKAATRRAYEAVPQDDAALYLPELASIRDEFFPPGAFGGRQAVDEAVSTARTIGTLQVPGVMPTRAPAGSASSLAQAVRGRGGISRTGDLPGEVRSLAGDVKNLVRVNGGQTPARMAEAMHEAGFISQPTPDALFDALRAEARGTHAGITVDSERTWRAAAEAAMGDAPGAQTLPQKVTLRQIDALRKSIGNAGRAAARDPERATEGAALGRMKAAIDDRINEVVRGDGAFDEVLPIQFADDLTKAQGLKRAQVQKYRTGPQAEAFRRGADNMPAVQGAEFAGKVWGNRAGIADDLKQFRQVLDENPRLLGEFRSMVTTEGAGTASAGGNLTSKFVRWVENALPGLRAGFEPAQVKMLERIAADIKRANIGAAAGMAQGSTTYQNASNALSLGLLDSAFVDVVGNKIPGVSALTGPGLNWLREGAREKMANQLAALLADPTQAANALAQLAARVPRQPGFAPNLLRLLPATSADQ